MDKQLNPWSMILTEYWMTHRRCQPQAHFSGYRHQRPRSSPWHLCLTRICCRCTGHLLGYVSNVHEGKTELDEQLDRPDWAQQIVDREERWTDFVRDFRPKGLRFLGRLTGHGDYASNPSNHISENGVWWGLDLNGLDLELENTFENRRS